MTSGGLLKIKGKVPRSLVSNIECQGPQSPKTTGLDSEKKNLDDEDDEYDDSLS